MSEGKLVKMEKDYSNEVDQLLTQVQPLVQGGQIEQALEKILSLEKQTRNGADLASTTKLLVASVEITRGANLWARLNEIVILLSKKHGQLKQAIVSMVQKAMTYLDETPDMETKLQLINTLRQVTEGKIFVEVERARVTLYLAKIHENEGKISEAADILQELQVETFGSMEKREKTEFLLEQMRLCLANGDYVRTLIISRKIGLNFFKNEENHDLKLRFYELMIQYASHENNYLDISKHYLEVYHTPSVQADDAKKKQALEQALIYVMLSPYDNEQSDLIHRIMQDPYLEKSAQHKELGTSFTTIELIRWPSLQELYGKSLLSIDPFVRGTEQGAKRWDDLHSRVIEHNIRVIEKYYTRITLKRMTELLDLDLDQTEDVLAKLVVSKTIYAKIDRPSGIVNFQAPKDANTILNEWTHDINKLLSLVEKTNHLIAKEEMVHKIVVRK